MKQAAIFIGVDKYREPISALRFARNDAQVLYQLFLKHYSPGLVDFICDDDVSDRNVIQRVRALVSKLDAGDSFMLYFSGHGAQDHEEHFLLGAEAEDLGGRWTGVLSVAQLAALTERPGIKRLFIIDSCRSALRQGARATGAESQGRDVAFEKLLGQNRRNGALPPAILCSCSSGEQAYEITPLRHGAFTQAMLELVGEAQGALELHDFAARTVQKVAAILAKYNLIGRQTPNLTSIPGETMMILGSEAPSGAVPPVPPPKPAPQVVPPPKPAQPVKPVAEVQICAAEPIEADATSAGEMFRNYLKKAEHGDAEAQFALGVMYENGQGVKQSDELALHWFRKAVEQGDKDTFSRLLKKTEAGKADAELTYFIAQCYESGHVVSKSKKRTVKWMAKAAEMGHLQATIWMNKNVRLVRKYRFDRKTTWLMAIILFVCSGLIGAVLYWMSKHVYLVDRFLGQPTDVEWIVVGVCWFFGSGPLAYLISRIIWYCFIKPRLPKA